MKPASPINQGTGFVTLRVTTDRPAEIREALAARDVQHVFKGDQNQAWDAVLEGLALFRATAYVPGIAACLCAAAFLAVADDPRRAARWLGPADPLQYISSIDRLRVDQVAQVGARRLGQTQFDAQRAAGRAASTA